VEDQKRMKTTLRKKTFTVIAVLAILVVSSLMVLVQAQAAQGELGKDLASDIRELVQTHKSDIKDFIIEAS
jgi:cell division protein FtsL